MKLRLPNDKDMDLTLTKVMGTIALVENDERTIDDLVLLADNYVKSGAELLEVGAKAGSKGIDETRVISVLGAILNKVDVPVAINSNSFDTLKQAIAAGASMVITTDGLAHEGVIDLVKDSDVCVCLQYKAETKIESTDDAVAMISEYFFSKIDTLLNAGISRKRLLIDPSVVNASVSSKLKVLGRLESFRSFALPICVAIPRQIPNEDSFMKDNHVLSLTTALFCAQNKAVQIVRTPDVSDVAIAIGFWQFMSSKTKPFKLSKAIVRRLRNMRDAIRDFKKLKK